jgi:hypothetical protein
VLVCRYVQTDVQVVVRGDGGLSPPRDGAAQALKCAPGECGRGAACKKS